MKFKKLLLAILPIFLLASCNLDLGLDFGDEDDTEEVENSYKLSESEITISVGMGLTLSVYRNGNKVSNGSVAWRSTSSNIASVNNGHVTGIDEGTATVSAFVGNSRVASCIVHVIDNEYNHNYSLNTNSLGIYVGSTYTLSFLRDGSPLPTSSLTFFSNNSNIASVTSGGLIRGVNPGQTMIGVTYKSTTEYCNVEVYAADNYHLSYSYFGIISGDSFCIDFYNNSTYINPYYVTWTSDNTSVATVDQGMIYGHNPGLTNINASFNGTTISCQVAVFTSDQYDAVYVYNSAQSHFSNMGLICEFVDGKESYLGVQNIQYPDQVTMFQQTLTTYELPILGQGQLYTGATYSPRDYANATFFVGFSSSSSNCSFELVFLSNTITMEIEYQTISNTDLTNYNVVAKNGEFDESEVIDGDFLNYAWNMISAANNYWANYYWNYIGIHLI